MKKVITFAITILLSVIGVYPQSPDLKIVTWERFESSTEEFSVETPSPFNVDGDTDPKSSRRYFAKVDDTFLYVFSDPLRTPYYYSVVNGFLKDWGKGTGEEKPDTAPRVLSFNDEFGYYQRLIVVRTAARVYIAQAVSRKQDDALAKRFISSFMIGDRRLPEIAPAQAPKESVGSASSTGETRPSTGAGAGSGSGSGSGSGQGAGSGRGSGIGSGAGITPPAPAKEPVVVSQLTILSKPRPGYTNLARFYSISGKVHVRVTFLSSGQIGSVTATQTLPFGLTNSAIEAARKITFQPKVQDGKPLSVTRLVEYTFAIY